MEKNVFFRALSEWGRGGDIHMPEVFVPFSRSAFLANKRSPFLPQCIFFKLWTVFRLFIYLPSHPSSRYSLFMSLSSLEFLYPKKEDQVAPIRVEARGRGFRWNENFLLMSSLGAPGGGNIFFILTFSGCQLRDMIPILKWEEGYKKFLSKDIFLFLYGHNGIYLCYTKSKKAD